MKKVVIACVDKYFEESGIDNVFIENEIYGSVSVKSVLSGGNYIREKKEDSFTIRSYESVIGVQLLLSNG